MANAIADDVNQRDFDGGVMLFEADDTGNLRPVWYGMRAADGKVLRFEHDEAASAAADAEFLNPDPLELVQLRPTLRAEVPPFRALVQGEQVLCVVVDGAVVRRVFIRRPLRGQAAIRHGLAILKRLDPEFVAYLREGMATARRIKRARQRGGAAVRRPPE